MAGHLDLLPPACRAASGGKSLWSGLSIIKRGSGAGFHCQGSCAAAAMPVQLAASKQQALQHAVPLEPVEFVRLDVTPRVQV